MESIESCGVAPKPAAREKQMPVGNGEAFPGRVSSCIVGSPVGIVHAAQAQRQCSCAFGRLGLGMSLLDREAGT
jgi:hypothetical protein